MTGELERLDDLLELPWMAKWAETPDFERFELRGQVVFVVEKNGTTFVVAFVDGLESP